MQQRVEQPVAAQQAFLFAGGQRAELCEPFHLRRVGRTRAFAGKIQAQAARQNRFQNPLRLGGKQNQNGFRRRFFEGFQKGVCGLRIQTVGRRDDGDFVFGLGRFELDFAHQIAHLLDGDDARFGFRPRPMDVGVGFVVNFPAAQTFVAAIGRHAAGLDRVLAVQGFGQRAGEQFQFFKLIAGEQIGVAQPPAGERALQQLDALRWFGKFLKAMCVSGENPPVQHFRCPAG